MSDPKRLSELDGGGSAEARALRRHEASRRASRPREDQR